MRKQFKRLAMLVSALVLAIPTAAVAGGHLVGPVFGLGTDAAGDVVVADAGQGVVAQSDGSLIAELPGVTDVAASDQGWLWAITGLPDAKLYKVLLDGTVMPFADLGAYEAAHNPHPAEIDSNPFSVIDGGGGAAIVADAGGNTLLEVNKHGKVKLIAVLPDELVSTANAKAIIEEILSNLFGEAVTCDALPAGAPPEAAEICGLPDMIPAEPVATSVAVGPDGDFYVGELKGFPAPLGESKVWRIRWNARNADCSKSPLCEVAFDGFTSVVDLVFGDDGTLYVAEMDEKSWFVVELMLFEGLPVNLGGGTINACNASCSVHQGNIPLLSAITIDGSGDLWHAELPGVVSSP